MELSLRHRVANRLLVEMLVKRMDKSCEEKKRTPIA